MHIPVSEVLGRQVIAGDLSCLAVIQAPGGQWNNEEAIPNLGALNDPWYLDVANDGRVLDLGRDKKHGTCGR